MRLIRLHHAALLAIALGLTACGGPNTGVIVDIAIEQGLQSDIRVAARSSKKPGVADGPRDRVPAALQCATQEIDP